MHAVRMQAGMASADDTRPASHEWDQKERIAISAPGEHGVVNAQFASFEGSRTVQMDELVMHPLVDGAPNGLDDVSGRGCCCQRSSARACMSLW